MTARTTFDPTAAALDENRTYLEVTRKHLAAGIVSDDATYRRHEAKLEAIVDALEASTSRPAPKPSAAVDAVLSEAQCAVDDFDDEYLMAALSGVAWDRFVERAQRLADACLAVADEDAVDAGIHTALVDLAGQLTQAVEDATADVG